MPSRHAIWLAALLVALGLPFFLVDVPPVLDYPNHLARYFVLAHADDPVLSRFYAPHWAVLPNMGFDVIGMWLLKILPVHLAGRLLLFISLIAPLLGVMAYSKAAFGRVTGWAFAGGTTAFNGVFFLGFMNFLLSLGLAFGAAAGWMVLRRGGWKTAVAFGAIASVVIFFCHIFGVALFALLIASQEAEKLLPRRNAKDALQAFVLVAGALAPALVLYSLSPLSAAGGTGGWDFGRKGWELFTPFMLYSKPVTLLTGVLLLGFLILTLRGARFAPGAKLALAVLAAAFIAAPGTLKGGTFVDVRLSLMLGLMLFASIAPNVQAHFAKSAALTLVLLIAARSLCVASVWQRHNGTLADLRAAIALIPPGSKVMAAQRKPTVTIPDLYRMDSHLPALALIERQAFWPQLFADPTQQPLMVRPPYDRIAQPSLSDLPEWETLLLTPGWRKQFDYVLLISRPTPLYKVEGAPQGLTPLYSGYSIALWRVQP